jgi:hypothetical protein
MYLVRCERSSLGFAGKYEKSKNEIDQSERIKYLR